MDKSDLSHTPLLNLKLNGEIFEPDQVQNVGGINNIEHKNTNQNHMEVSCLVIVEQDVKNLKFVTKDGTYVI